uniref:Uncharacterized protein n=1 Tax=Rhizophora mucronata TaxID=61149 RepID=A0A2P2PET6_RHIMU
MNDDFCETPSMFGKICPHEPHGSIKQFLLPTQFKRHTAGH